MFNTRSSQNVSLYHNRVTLHLYKVLNTILRKIQVFSCIEYLLISLYIISGFVTTGPSTAAISCLVARQLCSEQKTCSQILEVIPKTCGLELGKVQINYLIFLTKLKKMHKMEMYILKILFVFFSATCSTNTVTKCQAALRTLKGFDFFSPTCLCKEPRVEPKCNQLQNFIFDHPCDVASSFGK